MITANYQNGMPVRVSHVVDAGCGATEYCDGDPWFLLGASMGYEGIFTLVRASNLEEAVDAYIESDAGVCHRIEDKDIDDYLCDKCLALKTSGAENWYRDCTGDRFHWADGGIMYDTDHLDDGSDAPLEINWFAVDEERAESQRYNLNAASDHGKRAKQWMSDPAGRQAAERRMGTGLWTLEQLQEHEIRHNAKYAAMHARAFLAEATKKERRESTRVTP